MICLIAKMLFLEINFYRCSSYKQNLAKLYAGFATWTIRTWSPDISGIDEGESR
jgi:hypothetical protein